MNKTKMVSPAIKTPFWLLWLFFCGSTLTFGQQNYTISGTITDKSNGETLFGASVFLMETTIGGVTNEYGFYSIRNATMIIEVDEFVLLIDPMIGDQGTLPPFAFFKSKPKRNPIVPLPGNSSEILDRVTHCLITHKHPDHIDNEAIAFLIKKDIPVICSTLDEKFFRKKRLNVIQTIEYWQKTTFLGGKNRRYSCKTWLRICRETGGQCDGFLY